MRVLKTLIALQIIALGLFAQITFGQKTKPPIQPQVRQTPVALGKIYYLPEISDEPVPGANTTLMRSVLNSYINIIAWHFEMHFNDSELKEYERILVNDWNTNPTARKNINDSHTYLNKLKTMTSVQLVNEFFSRQEADNWDGLRQKMNLSNAPLRGLRAQIKQLAANSNPEGIFVSKKLAEYEKPLTPQKISGKSLTRKYVDATAEWIAYKINVVANKEILVLDDEKRGQMERLIISEWKTEAAKLSSLYEVNLTRNITRWQELRIHRGYSFDRFQTNYNKLSNMVEWANTAFYFCPAAKPYAEQRVKEYNDYVAKMNENEWQVEFNRLKLEQNLQNMAFEQMKRQQLEAHVLGLNIIEGLDDKNNYQWVIKEKP